jgi:drug/metabolite transporter (DMT)-like permease
MSPNLRGAAFMTLSMAGFAVEDLFLKAAALRMPTGQVILTVGLIGMAVFALLARARGEALWPRAFATRTMALRSGFEVAGRLFYALAVVLAPLATVTAILQATPLVVVAGAAVLFGERVGAARWGAVLAGLAGVLIVLRPGLDAVGPEALLAVLGMAGFAARDLATRAAPPALSNRQLGLAGFAMLALAGAVLLALSGGARLPDAGGAALLLGCAVFGLIGYNALTVAMRTGEVGFVTPFRYTRLLFGLLLAVLVLGERPDAATLVGAGLIVAAGVFTLTRGR